MSEGKSISVIEKDSIFLPSGSQINNLAVKLGLTSRYLSAEEIAYCEPSAKKLKQTLKTKQTYDLVKHVCSYDGLALEFVAKKLITPELCEIAVSQNGLAIRFVPEKMVNERLYDIAVSRDGRALEFVPENMRTLALVEKAVTHYLGDDRHQIMSEKEAIAEVYGAELGKFHKYPIAFVPSFMITKELLMKAVNYSAFCLRDIKKTRITKDMARNAVFSNGFAIKYVPERYISLELIEQAVNDQPLAIEYVPSEYVTKELCEMAFNKNYLAFPLIPEEYITESMCLSVIENKVIYIDWEEYSLEDTNLISFSELPEKVRNNEKILDKIIESCDINSDLLLRWNNKIIKERKDVYIDNPKSRRGIEIKPFRKKTVEFIKSRKIALDNAVTKEFPLGKQINNYLENGIQTENNSLIIPNLLQAHTIVKNTNGNALIHDLSEGESSATEIYYISDIHLEHQFFSKPNKILKNAASDEEREKFFQDELEIRIDEMLKEKEIWEGILLIGGDVASNKEFSAAFYDCLRSRWDGTIVSILGNHELWDGTGPREWNDPEYHARSVEEIIKDYKNRIDYIQKSPFTGYKRLKSVLLENSVFIKYKNGTSCVIPEEDILNSEVNELSDILLKSSVIILGGIGFSGLNPIHNANSGLYRKAITTKEDELFHTQHFQAVYEKVKACAYDRKVIVFTHTPVSDWTAEDYNPNWIYVNGHTHKNSLLVEENGPTVFSDNQVGYQPRKWHLNSFQYNCWYDPFEKYNDGIYPISREVYEEFNRGRGIYCSGCNYDGHIFMLKRNDKYMFLLQAKKHFYLLIGGQRKNLENSAQYYYENMEAYIEKISDILKPHRLVLKQISEQVKRTGGTGLIHGSIVDVSYLSHIYLNPYDGTITPYWATDIRSRIPYNSYKELIEEKEPELLKKYLSECKKGTVPLLDANPLGEEQMVKAAILPRWVYGTEIYGPSRLLKATQYIWEKNVIRIWNDDVLNGRMQLTD